MNILITGGTGFVGAALIPKLLEEGHIIIAVSRSSRLYQQGVHYIPAPRDGELFSPAILAKVEAIINLAGENIGDRRWTSSAKTAIENSRIDITRQIVQSIHRNQQQGLAYPRILINASAVGYYGTSNAASFTEDSPQGAGFLASVCQHWEQEALAARLANVRVALLRFGIILGPGGALKRMALPFQFGAGGVIGDGKQWCSWVHRQDVAAAISFALTQPLEGPYNVCSPYPVTMEEFMTTLAAVLGKKSWTAMPPWAARLLFGEMADELLLNGQRAFPQRLEKAGFSFAFGSLKEALVDIYPR